MYKIRNKLKQRIQVSVVSEGKEKRVSINSRNFVYSEEVTNQIERLSRKGIVRVMEVEEEDEEDIDVESSFDNS